MLTDTALRKGALTSTGHQRWSTRSLTGLGNDCRRGGDQHIERNLVDRRLVSHRRSCGRS